MKLSSLFGLAITVLPLLGNAAWGDIAPMRTVDGPGLSSYDIACNQIEMSGEEVSLVMDKQTLTVKATFLMKNTGPEVKIHEGFPAGPYPKALKDFTASVGSTPLVTNEVNLNEGKELPEPREPGMKIEASYWVVWDHVYPAEATEKVEVNYRMDLGSAETSVLDKNMNYYRSGYILHTGAAWKGMIGRAVVTLTFQGGLSPLHVSSISKSDEAVVQSDRIEWTFTQLEPQATDDIKIQCFSESFPTLADAYRFGPQRFKQHCAILEVAGLHDRDLYWEVAGRIFSMGSRDEHGNITLAGDGSAHEDDNSRYWQQAFTDLFQESLKYAGKEAKARQNLAAGTDFIEKMLNNRVMIDHTKVVYPSGERGEVEFFEINGDAGFTQEERAQLVRDVEKAKALLAQKTK